MNSRRRKLVPFWVFTLCGSMVLFNSLGNPRLASLRGPDVLQLVAIGVCFGVALATLVAFFRGPRSG